MHQELKQLLPERQEYGRNKGVMFKNFAPFTDCISEMINTRIDNVRDVYFNVQIYANIII